MKTKILGVTIIAFLCMAFQPKQLHKSFFTLEGRWQMFKNKETIIEEWKKSSASLLVGKSYKIKANNDTLNLETMQLKMEAGKTYFIPVTANQNNEKPVKFLLTKQANNRFEFVNLKHDFPKRIVYHIVNKDSIHAWIDDNFDQTEYRLDFYYSRIK